MENLPGRCAFQFESDFDPLLSLQALSRRNPGITFLLEYERRRVKGLAKLKRGEITRHEINY